MRRSWLIVVALVVLLAATQAQAQCRSGVCPIRVVIDVPAVKIDLTVPLRPVLPPVVRRTVVVQRPWGSRVVVVQRRARLWHRRTVW